MGLQIPSGLIKNGRIPQMAFSRPTLQQLVDRISGDFVAKITGASTLAMRSVLKTMAIIYAGAVHLLYGYLDNMTKQLFAATATADIDGGKLDTIGSEYGIIRNAATKAVGIITCTGTPATLIPKGSALASTAGIQYITDADATIGGGGSITAAITAETAGIDGNDDPAIVLTFVSPIAGVDSTATVDSDGLYNGADEEVDDAYRLRVLARKQLAPHGGDANDLEQWTKEVDGVTRAWVYPQYNGPGTVAVYFVRDGQSPITPTAGQIATVLAYLTSHTDALGQIIGVPVTMLPGLFVAAPTLLPLNFTIKLYPNTADVQTTVQAQLVDLIYREAYPGQTLYLSRIQEAISAAIGEERSAIVTPASDVALAYNEVGQLGTITWQAY